MLTFNKLVKKLGNKRGKVIFRSDIYDIIDPEKKGKYKHYVDKIIYQLKAGKYIISMRSGVYIVPFDEDILLNEVDIVEKYFLKLLKKYIIKNVGTQYYIGGQKALSFHMKDYSIPEYISIINPSIQKKIYIKDYVIQFKTITGNKRFHKKQNLYPIFKNYSIKKNIFGIDFIIAGLELALIESAIIHEGNEGIDITLISRCIKKYRKTLDHHIFDEIGKWKYNMAFNRIKELSKSIDVKLSQTCLNIIKKNGGCFVGEGLRNM